MVNIWSPSATVGSLDQNYHYKSEATQIIHDTGLAPIRYIGQKFFPHLGLKQCRILYYEFKAERFKPHDHWAEIQQQ